MNKFFSFFSVYSYFIQLLHIIIVDNYFVGLMGLFDWPITREFWNFGDSPIRKGNSKPVLGGSHFFGGTDRFRFSHDVMRT